MVMEKHLFAYLVNYDNDVHLKMYLEFYDFPLWDANKKIIDIDMITPDKNKIFKWFMEEYDEIEKYKLLSLRSMTNIIKSRVLNKEIKLKYLDFRSLNDAIDQAKV